MVRMRDFADLGDIIGKFFKVINSQRRTNRFHNLLRPDQFPLRNQGANAAGQLIVLSRRFFRRNRLRRAAYRTK
jgi:hypothetical protein